MTRDVLALVDGAIGDWEMSGDAMRWRPDKPPRTPPLSPEHTEQIRADLDRFNAYWAQIHAQLTEAFRSIGQAAAQMVPAITELAEALDPAAAATRGATSPRVPAYRDARPRWQSPYGPPRRAR